MDRTIVIRRDYLHYVKKYNRYEKRHRNLSAHCSPAFIGVSIGDIVTVGECRYAQTHCPEHLLILPVAPSPRPSASTS